VATLLGREQAAAEHRAEALTAYSRQYVLGRDVVDSTGLGRKNTDYSGFGSKDKIAIVTGASHVIERAIAIGPGPVALRAVRSCQVHHCRSYGIPNA
jgi:hypothetical protein